MGKINTRPLQMLVTIVLLDFVIFVFFVLIPAAIVKKIDPCIKNYGDGLWYVFQTITTIGFGDVIAGVDYSGDWCEGVEIGFHFTNFFWFCKMCFLLIALSFMAATWILKYEIILELFYGNPANGRRQLIDNNTLNAAE